MKRYWFEFKINQIMGAPFGIQLGCGITAFNFEDAMSILKEKIFREQDTPQIIKCVEDIDLSTLDSNHIIPNINPNSPPTMRGVWFPIGY